MATEFKLSYTGSQINEKLNKIDSLAAKSEIPTKTSQLANDAGFLTSYTETDPTVPAWAKAYSKPSYTASEVGALSASELPEAINTALAQAKESGSFDGEDGRGIKSIVRTSGTGAAGTTDTYTVTYTDNTTSTISVYNGKDGTNGTSVTVSSVTESTEDGGTNIVKFSDGKTVNIKNGKTGAPGKTPVRGTDYWTEADLAAIIQQVIDTLGGTPVFGLVDADNNIVITGNLAGGTYMVKFEESDGTLTEIGDIVVGDDPGFVELDYVYNTKIDKTTGAETTDSKYHTHQLVPYNSSFTYKVTVSTKNGFYCVCAVCWYDADRQFIGWNEVGGDGYDDSLGGQNQGEELVSYSRNLVPLENSAYFKLRIYSAMFVAQNNVNGGITVEKIRG